MAVDPNYAWSVVVGIYNQVTSSRGYNFTPGADERNDLDNRIRGGQTIEQITNNTYDDANRRFPPNTAPNVQDTTTRDAQSNSGPQYSAPAALISSVVAAAPVVQAAAVGPGALTSDLSSGPGGPIGPRAVAGAPAANVRYSSAGTGAGTFNLGGSGGGLFGFDTTTLLIIAAVGVGAFFLLKKK